MKRLAYFALATTLLGFTNAPQKALTNEEAKKSATVITGDRLKDFLTFIAADALQGRDTPSPGLDAAANFIAYNLKSWGVKPGGDDGTYFQNMKLSRVAYDSATTKLTTGGDSYSVGSDFIVASGAGRVTGELLYIGVKGEQHDYKGKIVLVGRQADQDEGLFIRGGALAIIKDSTYTGGSWNAMVDAAQHFGGGFQPYRGEGPTNTGGPSIPPSLRINADAFKKLAVKSGSQATLNVTSKTEFAMTRNVVGIVEGSDPTLKSEYVALGAHYDHVGMDPTRTGEDKIFNGADDDGSGTVSILNIAEAAAKSATKPKRSFLFVWHCGEEKGLWGSAYFNQHTTVPKASIVAQLNIDMIGRSKKAGDTNPRNKSLTGPNEIYVIGTTMMSTRLGEIVHGVNEKYLQVTYDKRYDDPKDPNQFFYRSDHYNYARNGIPICFWFDGEHEDYHQVGDEVSKIDFTKMEKVARTVYVTGVTVANEPTRPKVDKPLNR